MQLSAVVIILFVGFIYFFMTNAESATSYGAGETITVSTREKMPISITHPVDMAVVQFSGMNQGLKKDDFQFKTKYPAPMKVTITVSPGDIYNVGFGCDPHFRKNFISTTTSSSWSSASISSPSTFICGKGHIQVQCDISKSSCGDPYTLLIEFFRIENKARNIRINQHNNG